MRKIALTFLSMSIIGLSIAQKTNSTSPKQVEANQAQPKETVILPSPNGLDPIIKFETTTFDYGVIKEEKGPANGVFKFKNVGKADLQILSVRPSCGCTTSEYTKEAIKPGGSGVIKATYDPARRPGEFNKSISVVTNDPKNQNMMIFIKGNVIEKPKSKDELYPVQQGGLRFLTNHLSFNLTNVETKIDTLKVYNSSKKKMDLKYDKLPNYITILNPIVTKLDTGAVAKIIVKYDAVKRQEIGFVYDKFTIFTNDSTQIEKIVYLSANISEDFSKLTPEQLANAPVLAVDSDTYDFGKVNIGAVVEYDYVLKNTGKSILVIRKVKASCGCTAAQPEKMEIEPGQSTKIKASFNSAGRPGQQHKTITVITNDPKKSSITLTLKGEVLKEDSIEIKGDPKKGEGSGTMYKIK
ncbi:MAG: DUF1573 domain-containing protein [Bacteroidota bacterium]